MTLMERAEALVKNFEETVATATEADKAAVEAAIHAELANVDTKLLALKAKFLNAGKQI